MALSRSVFEIIVVKHSNGEIIDSKRLTATSTESAMAKMGLKDICDKAGVSTDDVEFIILKLGSLRTIDEVKNTDITGL